MFIYIYIICVCVCTYNTYAFNDKCSCYELKFYQILSKKNNNNLILIIKYLPSVKSFVPTYFYKIGISF